MDVLRIGLLVTDYLGNTKGEFAYYTLSDAMRKIADLISWPDTKVYVYNTDRTGARTGNTTALVTANGWENL